MDSNHLSKARVVTLVTSHSSGSLCPNQMELQNGCVSLAHASTLFHRHLLDHVPESGVVDNEKLRENLDLAADAYISRVDVAPCGTLQYTYTKLLMIMFRSGDFANLPQRIKRS